MVHQIGRPIIWGSSATKSTVIGAWVGCIGVMGTKCCSLAEFTPWFWDAWGMWAAGAYAGSCADVPSPFLALRSCLSRLVSRAHFLRILTRSNNVTLSELFLRSPSLIWTGCGGLWMWDLCFTIWNAYDKLKTNAWWKYDAHAMCNLELIHDFYNPLGKISESNWLL